MRSILKQASWLLVAQTFTRAVGFFYTIFLARSLGVEEFGLLTVALAYFSIISSFADFGFNRFLVREISKDKSRISDLVCNIIMLRLTFAAILFGIFSVCLYFLDPDKMRVSIILLASTAILPQAIALTMDGIFMALQKLQYSGISLFISSLFTVILGFLMVREGWGVVGAINALIFGQVVYVFTLFLLLSRVKVSVLSVISFSQIKKIIAGSFPYGLLGILGLLYFKIDTILLSYIRGSYETGLYGAGYKFLEAIIFIPGAFGIALFPSLARLHQGDKEDMKSIYFKSLKLMLLLGILLFLSYLIILPELIEIYLPSYKEAIDAVKILSLSIPFIFLATPGVQVLFSSEKYLKSILFISIFTLLFNVILNLIFIPKYGFLAAAWITVVSEIFSFTIFFFFVKNKILKN